MFTGELTCGDLIKLAKPIEIPNQKISVGDFFMVLKINEKGDYMFQGVFYSLRHKKTINYLTFEEIDTVYKCSLVNPQ